MRVLFRVALASFLSLSAVSTAFAVERTFGPFTVDDAKPDVISLNGEIDVNSGLNFRRALQAAPNAKLITLNSVGGNVQMGLLIADDIHQRKLATYIAKDSECLSACSFVFLAGNERKVDGALGVHQISSQSPDLVGAQLAISDIIEVLNRFGTPMDVMHVMFKTPPDDMHIFSQEEIERFKLNRKDGQQLSTPAVIDVPISTSEANQDERTDQFELSEEDAVVLPEPSQQANLSTLDQYTRRPNRIAVFTGLDLFGDDISSVRTEGAGECAQRCLVMDGQCKAFTFNSNPKIKRGPNCFLKSNAGRADGNSVAFSGRFLSGAESDPSPITLGTIDPNSALFESVDLRGGDLSRRPHHAARTPLDCRLACIDEKQCVAFTYVKLKKECWLKGELGTPMNTKGMVSGLKKIERFEPAQIISLD